MGTSEPCSITDTKLKRIAWLSARDPEKRFDCVMHLFNEESLAGCFHGLDGRKAVGIDGVDKATYGAELNERLEAVGGTDEANGLPTGTGTTSTYPQGG